MTSAAKGILGQRAWPQSSGEQRKLQQQDMAPFQPLESSLQSKAEENVQNGKEEGDPPGGPVVRTSHFQ